MFQTWFDLGPIIAVAAVLLWGDQAGVERKGFAEAMQSGPCLARPGCHVVRVAAGTVTNLTRPEVSFLFWGDWDFPSDRRARPAMMGIYGNDFPDGARPGDSRRVVGTYGERLCR